MKIADEKSLSVFLALFNGGAKLTGAEYKCTEKATEAKLSFEGQKNFCLKLTGVQCVHITPIAVGNPFVENVSAGFIGKLFFFADDEFFNVNEPDTSLTYIIAENAEVIS